MYQTLAIILCGIWAAGGPFLALANRETRVEGITVTIVGLLGLGLIQHAMFLSY